MIQYWDGLIKQLELYMDVIDDPIEVSKDQMRVHKGGL